jgi:peptidoglycan LD-endopeptidase LytH
VILGVLLMKSGETMRTGKFITRGEIIGHFGNAKENGDWPPHVHFQIIEDIGMHVGDYPGVCSLNEAQKYIANCPDANLMLNL